jgi:carbon monoxide dehydrogenase subunit G
MKLEQSFNVAAPVEQVWAALIDVERVAPCLPGAEITGHDDEGAYHGTFTVKLGPTTASYNGTLRLDDVDEAAHAVVMSARGTDKRGQGGATATIRSVVAPDGDGTKVEVDTDFTITGRLARFGRGGMIEDVSRRLLADFSSCLQERIVAHAPPAQSETTGAAPPPPPPPPAPAKPVNGLRLFFQVLADRIRRLFHRRG